MTIDDELAKMGWRPNPDMVSPPIRNMRRELPAAGETTPAARTPNSDHATDGDSDGIVCE